MMNRGSSSLPWATPINAPNPLFLELCWLENLTLEFCCVCNFLSLVGKHRWGEMVWGLVAQVASENRSVRNCFAELYPFLNHSFARFVFCQERNPLKLLDLVEVLRFVLVELVEREGTAFDSRLYHFLRRVRVQRDSERFYPQIPQHLCDFSSRLTGGFKVEIFGLAQTDESEAWRGNRSLCVENGGLLGFAFEVAQIEKVANFASHRVIYGPQHATRGFAFFKDPECDGINLLCSKITNFDIYVHNPSYVNNLLSFP